LNQAIKTWDEATGEYQSCDEALAYNVCGYGIEREVYFDGIRREINKEDKKLVTVYVFQW